MALQVIGAGLPRTGTFSLGHALEHLLGGPFYHMRELPGHPFELGPAWKLALAGGSPDWDELYDGYVAAVDWPASLFWRELSAAYPDALVLLSVRASAEVWWHSAEATILPVARMSVGPDWQDGNDFTALLERFTGTAQWDDRATLMAAYERHNAAVREAVPPERLLEWRPAGGWEPICEALGMAVPAMPFPWLNQRAEWA